MTSRRVHKSTSLRSLSYSGYVYYLTSGFLASPQYNQPPTQPDRMRHEHETNTCTSCAASSISTHALLRGHGSLMTLRTVSCHCGLSVLLGAAEGQRP